MEKKYAFSFLTLALLASTAVTAQFSPVTLTNAAGDVVNGTTIQVQQELTGDIGQILVQPLDVQNDNSAQRTINVKRYELSYQPGTENYFCWGVCYDAVPGGARPLWVSQHYVQMGAGETSSNFYGDYKPLGQTGTSSYLFVWYDMDSPNDSSWVTINYTALEAVGIAEVSAVRGFSAFPNPSVAGNITFNYDLAKASAGTQLVVYNMLGERKLVKAISAAQGTVVLNDGELTSGAWFAVLERNGKPLATKRLVVLR